MCRNYMQPQHSQENQTKMTIERRGEFDLFDFPTLSPFFHFPSFLFRLIALSSSLLHRLHSFSLSDHIHLYEWSHTGWSYHAKGMWLSIQPKSNTSVQDKSQSQSGSSHSSSSSSASSSSSSSSPILTVIGSPNYGERSVQRDSETSIIILTQSDSTLSKQLKEEKENILQYAHRVRLDQDEVSESESSQVAIPPPYWIRILAKLALPYM